MTPGACAEFAQRCFVQACRLDVAVRKPGNVSLASPGHGMDAKLFIDSAQAAAAPLCASGARVGTRIEAAQAASMAAAGCNTNLGIVLLCAPIAAAVERHGALAGRASLQGAIEAVLAELDVADACAVFRAIALADPGGLGHVASQDVRGAPSVDLRSAMVMAASRDLVARQYANGYADLFKQALPELQPGFTPIGSKARFEDVARQVQRLYLLLLATRPDSHIVRKHGISLAQTVMRSAQAWQGRSDPGADPAFAAWDEALKAEGINPGTTADLTVAALFLALLLTPEVGRLA